MSRIRIGIDVGGTFTHAVALNAVDGELLAQVRVPTTHRAPEGVAAGIVASLLQLLEAGGLEPSAVDFIAHSTTQATNALLEGDVASVGVIGMGSGMEGRRARGETSLGDIELAPGRFLRTYHRFLDTAAEPSEEVVGASVRSLEQDGAEVIAACQVFGVDDPRLENRVTAVATGFGLPATAGHEVSQLYGLRMRTRTTVINASMLPRMMETARMTDESVRRAGIGAPLMVMRSDGGVMSVEEMVRRPILTILSGPAAGVAAALKYARVSYGIFVEVGGTSTDISLIMDGRPAFRPAVVGGHRLYVETLDVRTVGLAGGSLIRLSGTKIADVGPRSAHIAGLAYASFSEIPDAEMRLELFSPRPGDPADYVRIVAPGGETLALTPTCAARFLAGEGPAGLAGAFRALASHTGMEAGEAARAVLRAGCDKLVPVINGLMRENKLSGDELILCGGGGGAPAILPSLAERTGMSYRLVDNAPVISAIGVAMAMVRDVVERNMVNPGPEDLQRIRREAEAAALRSGALAPTIEVRLEVDRQRQLVRAVATGATELRSGHESRLDEEALRRAAAEGMGLAPEAVDRAGGSGDMTVFSGSRVQKRLFGLFSSTASPACVVDGVGIVRLRRRHARVVTASVGEAPGTLGRILERETVYGDAGASLPGVFLLAGGRLVDLSGLTTPEQVQALAATETEGLDKEGEIILIAERR